MHTLQIEIQIVAVIAAIACSLLGVFLVLRKTAMVADAVSHSILPGLVIGFLLTENLNHPLLIIMAAMSGLLAVWSVNKLSASGRLRVDAAIGLVFPFLFAIGIILIHVFADDIHLDTDAVLSGELVYVPFDRLVVGGMDLGPQAAWKGLSILLCIVIFIVGAFHWLKISTFDPLLTQTLGIPSGLLQQTLMVLTAFIVVTAFDIVGAVLVVGFIIIPASTAFLLTYSLKRMLIYSVCIAIVSVLLGYFIAHLLDVSIAGSIVTVMGVLFGLAYLFSHEEGLLRNAYRLKKLRGLHYQTTLLIHLLSHDEREERHVAHLHEHINWSEKLAQQVVKKNLEEGFLRMDENVLHITIKGREFVLERLKQTFE
ncbi:MAG: metal ABC transporter permease [Weeksellaceae bacterium]|nr:metal ABC transporter permease [Weeksellaceae bacterium]